MSAPRMQWIPLFAVDGGVKPLFSTSSLPVPATAPTPAEAAPEGRDYCNSASSPATAADLYETQPSDDLDATRPVGGGLQPRDLAGC